MLPRSNPCATQACVCLTIILHLVRSYNSTSCCMPRAGSTGSPYQLTGGCAGGCAPNRWWQKRSCSATCAVPLVPGHHGIFQSLEDKGTSLSQERAPAASPEAVPSSSPRVKGDPGGTKRDTGLLQPPQRFGNQSDLGPQAQCSSCSAGFFATPSSPLNRHISSPAQRSCQLRALLV